MVVVMLMVSGSLQAQDVKRSVDTFTGDTIWETKYGRLDDAHGCSRSNLAIVWKLIRGSHSHSEWLTYQYFDVGALRAARWMNAVSAAINIDGQIIELKEHPMSPHIEGGGDDKSEYGAFVLPDSTLLRVADAASTKIRFVGTDRVCDGTVEQNMKDRLHHLLEATR